MWSSCLPVAYGLNQSGYTKSETLTRRPSGSVIVYAQASTGSHSSTATSVPVAVSTQWFAVGSPTNSHASCDTVAETEFAPRSQVPPWSRIGVTNTRA